MVPQFSQTVELEVSTRLLVVVLFDSSGSLETGMSPCVWGAFISVRPFQTPVVCEAPRCVVSECIPVGYLIIAGIKGKNNSFLYNPHDIRITGSVEIPKLSSVRPLNDNTANTVPHTGAEL